MGYWWQVGGERAARDGCDLVLHQRHGCHAPGALRPVHALPRAEHGGRDAGHQALKCCSARPSITSHFWGKPSYLYVGLAYKQQECVDW